DDVGVACHPADVGCTPVDIVVPRIKDPSHGRVQKGKVSTSIVDLAFGPAGCPRSVEYVEGVFGFDRLRLNVHRLGGFSQNIIKERVPIFLHRNLVPCVSDDNDLLYAGSFLRGPVCDLFELDEVAPSSATVSSDE